MQTKGRFILCSSDEFASWLSAASVSRSITLLQNHHTWSPAYGQFSGDNHLALLTAMEAFHVKERGFDMIAQNLTTFPDGSVAVCRPLDRIPAGIKGANQGGICIEHLGNFDTGGDQMSAPHRDTIVTVNALLCRRFSLTPSTDAIVYHHWYDLDSGKRTGGSGNTKSCPGSAFFGGNSIAAAADGFVPLVQQQLAAARSAAPQQPLRSAEVAVESLNVRGGVGMTYAVLKQVKRGVALPIYEERGGWCRVAVDRQEWVCARYLVGC